MYFNFNHNKMLYNAILADIQQLNPEKYINIDSKINGWCGISWINDVIEDRHKEDMFLDNKDIKVIEQELTNESNDLLNEVDNQHNQMKLLFAKIFENDNFKKLYNKMSFTNKFNNMDDYKNIDISIAYKIIFYVKHDNQKDENKDYEFLKTMPKNELVMIEDNKEEILNIKNLISSLTQIISKNRVLLFWININK